MSVNISANFSHFSFLRHRQPSFCRSSSMDSGRANFKDFPYVSGSHRSLMLDLLSFLENRLESSLRPCTLPIDVQQFSNPNGNAQASLNLRSAIPTSQIDFVLGSWFHCKLPSGGAMNITSLSAYLKPLTDAPHFLLELIQTDPTSLIVVLDLPPRKDLILHPDYLKTYYEDTELDRHRQRLEKLPEVKPYISPSLYLRAVLSPTAILACIDNSGEGNILREHVDPIAKEMLELWIEKCACLERNVGKSEMVSLGERDRIMKNKSIDVDSFPKLFGQENADRVSRVLKEFYNR